MRIERRSKNTRRSAWMLGASLTLLAGIVPAAAQAQPEGQQAVDLEEVVITGSSIRGVPPTGSNLIELGAQAVVETGAATTQELLATIPQLGTFNTAPRPDPHSGGFLSTAPNIRGLGQAQTLVLVNGHRLVGTGYLQNIADPSIVPPSIISRVEVVADGTSSVYGSDGLAGVVNVITLREYEGASSSVRYGWGKNYDLFNANAVIGDRWDAGGVVASVEYSRNSRLEGFDRDYVTNDFSSAGGRDNRATNSCIPSQFQVNNAAGNATGDIITFGSGGRNERCDNAGYTDLYPRYERLSFFAAGHQAIAPNVEVYFDAFHSKYNSDANLQPANGSGTITRSNPFFPTAQVDALPGGAAINSITAYYNLSNLLGVRLRDVQDITVYGGTAGLDVTLGTFKWSTYLTGSRSTTNLHEGSFNPEANSTALAGTTTATALDPFSGRTSESVRVGIANYEQYFGARQYLWELNTKVDGPLFAVPAGDVKIAVGGVYRKEFNDGKNTLSRIGFEENLGREVARRTVHSAFGELFIPLFSEANALPFVRRLDVSLSGRYDHYNDFGSTTNPKVGVNWDPVDGLTLRGSYGTSFHAPALPDLAGPDTRAGFYSGGGAPAGVTPASFPGNIYIAGGNPNLKPETATTWSLGADFAPDFFPGFRASGTFYSVDFKGRIAFPVQFGNFFYQLPEVSIYFLDNITCAGGTPYPIPNTSGAQCTAAPIDPQKVYAAIQGLRLQNFPRPVTGPADLPPVYFLQDLRRVNLSRIKTQGLDFDVSYRWAMGDTNIAAQLQGNRIFKFDQQAVPGAPFVSQFDYGQARFKMRAALSAANGPFTGVVAVNYSDKYKSQYVAVSGATSTNAVETVGSFTTVDVHLGYKLADFGPLADVELTVDADNLLDEEPPFMRSGNGYGAGNVLGRVLTVGIRTTF